MGTHARLSTRVTWEARGDLELSLDANQNGGREWICTSTFCNETNQVRAIICRFLGDYGSWICYI